MPKMVIVFTQDLEDDIHILPAYRGETFKKPNILYDKEHDCYYGDAVDRLSDYESLGYGPNALRELVKAIEEDRVRIAPEGSKWAN